MRFTTSLAVLLSLLASGCATYPDGLASTGPSQETILAPSAESPAIAVLPVTAEITQRLTAEANKPSLSSLFTHAAPFDYRVGYGDSLEVSVWEAMPATLFGGSAPAGYGAVSVGSGATVFPEMVVSRSGAIDVPFAGHVPVIGKSLESIQADIEARLTGKANQPQVVVRLLNNASASVTVVGEVEQSLRMPLTASGERLLDAVAAAGGVKQSADKITLQVSRSGRVSAAPMADVIRSPTENIPLQPGDVITAQFQPLSLSVLGATGKNDELPFEASGISLSQALARAGGLDDARADAQGVFVFRFEDKAALVDVISTTTTTRGVPVVYQLDLKNPAAFLLAQQFPMRDKDVLYVTNAPAAELQKFLNIISATVFSVTGLASVPN